MPRTLFQLSQTERELLSRYYNFYLSLADGSRSPTTKAQRHFVAVCQGDAEPTTVHESAYLNLRRLARLTRMSESQIAAYDFAVEAVIQDDESPNVAAPIPLKPAAPSDFDMSEFDEFGEGAPRPGWFTDEGWKRMRGGYRFDSR